MPQKTRQGLALDIATDLPCVLTTEVTADIIDESVTRNMGIAAPAQEPRTTRRKAHAATERPLRLSWFLYEPTLVHQEAAGKV